MLISMRGGSHLVHRIGGIDIDLVAVIDIDIIIESRPSHLSTSERPQPERPPTRKLKYSRPKVNL